jgi:hypothetical protein
MTMTPGEALWMPSKRGIARIPNWRAIASAGPSSPLPGRK